MIQKTRTNLESEKAKNHLKQIQKVNSIAKSFSYFKTKKKKREVNEHFKDYKEYLSAQQVEIMFGKLPHKLLTVMSDSIDYKQVLWILVLLLGLGNKIDRFLMHNQLK